MIDVKWTKKQLEKQKKEYAKGIQKHPEIRETEWNNKKWKKTYVRSA